MFCIYDTHMNHTYDQAWALYIYNIPAFHYSLIYNERRVYMFCTYDTHVNHTYDQAWALYIYYIPALSLFINIQ
jgi:hypothetical protein